MPRILSALNGFLFVLVLVGCASDRNLRANRATIPRYLELEQEQAIATVHFPRGNYSLAEEDRDGYYYRSPRKVIKHAFAGPQSYDGGIFVDKKRGALRGYIIWAGGRTRIGNLSRAPYRYSD